jgi:flagellar FliL protein
MAEERAEKAESGAVAKTGKSNLILIVIIAVLGTILVGGGVTAFFLLKKDGGQTEEAVAEKAAAEDEEAPKADAKKKGKAKDKDKKAGPKSPAIYVALEPPFVVNFDATQSSRFLQVTVEVMTRDSSMSQMIKDNDPAVRNDLLMLFGAQDATVIGTREGKEALRKDTLETVRSLIKAEGGDPELVEAVYFTTFVMQ